MEGTGEVVPLHAAASDEGSEDPELGTKGAPARARWPVCLAGRLSAALLAAALLASVHLKRAPAAVHGRWGSSVLEELSERIKRRAVHKEKKHDKTPPGKPLPTMNTGFPRGKLTPSLFCWSVMNMKNPAEIAILRGQLRNRTGIYGCDTAAVLSAENLLLGDGHLLPNGSHVQVYSWKNPAHVAVMGNMASGDSTPSFKNTDIFINAWDILIKSRTPLFHDWTAKVDPDAVFFAHRLRWHVKRLPIGTTPFYIKNCENQGPQLYGALEVFNKAAMQAYKDKGDNCKALPWAGWGEDEWIDRCMQQVGAQPQIDYKLVGDHRCMAAECWDTERVAFHDYKSEALYYDCWQKSNHSEKMHKQIEEGGYFCCTYNAPGAEACNSCDPHSRIRTGFCGGSKSSCSQCGKSATWCRMADKFTAVVAE